MAATIPILDPLLADARRCGDPTRTRHIGLGQDMFGSVGPWLAEHHAGQVDILVADAHTWDAAGARLEAALTSAGRLVCPMILEPIAGDAHLVCEDGVIEALATFLATSDRMNVLAVGSGTVTDICKVASHQTGRPFQVVPTAASMNGYTSSIAAVLSDGVKRTRQVQQAEAVFADVDLLRRAPPAMGSAGFGDLLSKPFAQADWLLSHLTRGVAYSDEAARLLDGPWRQMVDQADGIGRGEPAAMEILMETLLVSGFSMALAGTSAPASGAEHLMSHYWDMEQHCQGQPVRALHGTQVGIGTLLSSMILSRLVSLHGDQMDPLAAASRRPTLDWIDTIDDVHPSLTPDVMAEVKQQLAQKQRAGDALRDEISQVAANWPEIRSRLADVILPPATIRDALESAGCLTRARDIGVERGHLVRTLRVCRHIRSRTTCLDLADDLGLLHGWAEAAAAATEDSHRG